MSTWRATRLIGTNLREKSDPDPTFDKNTGSGFDHRRKPDPEPPLFLTIKINLFLFFYINVIIIDILILYYHFGSGSATLAETYSIRTDTLEPVGSSTHSIFVNIIVRLAKNINMFFNVKPKIIWLRVRIFQNNFKLGNYKT